MRRGQHNLIISMVLVGFFLVIAIVIYGMIRSAYFSSADNRECAASIKAAQAAGTMTKSYAAADVVCPTRVVEAGADPRQTIGDEMLKCWDAWGQGKYTLFGDKEGTFCHVCSMITTSEPRVDGLLPYLRDEGYIDKIIGQKTGALYDETQFSAHAQDSMDASQGLAVLFVYTKGSGVLDSLQRGTIGNPLATTAVATLTVGVVAATAEFSVPIIAISSLAAGNTAFILSFKARPDYDTMSQVLVRPLSPEQIADTGCQYAPVKEKE